MAQEGITTIIRGMDLVPALRSRRHPTQRLHKYQEVEEHRRLTLQRLFTNNRINFRLTVGVVEMVLVAV